ncbi:MAG: cation:dicarboxylase symporter family transporter, partial [Gammaproteobacteria bacterium]
MPSAICARRPRRSTSPSFPGGARAAATQIQRGSCNIGASFCLRDGYMKLALHTRVLIGFLVGTLGGALAFYWAQHGGDASLLNGFVDTITQPAGQLFLRFLKMLVLPLMFSALIVGVTEIGDIASLGRVGLR